MERSNRPSVTEVMSRSLRDHSNILQTTKRLVNAGMRSILYQMGRWIHEFFKEPGDLVQQLHNTMLHKVHKFRTDAAIFDDVLVKTEEAKAYLDKYYDIEAASSTRD